MALRYRYTEWDGTQEIPPLDADDVLEGLTDDLMNFGDLQHALRNMMQRGVKSPMGNRTQGLRDLLQQLRQQRRQTLDKFDLSSVFEDQQRQLDEILDLERETLDERLPESTMASGPQNGGPQDGQDAGSEDGGSSDGGSEYGDPSDGESGPRDGEGGAAGQRGQSPDMSRAHGRRSQASPPQGGKPGEDDGGGQEGGSGPGDGAEFEEMLRKIVERKQGFLDELPEDTAGQMRELQNYEFMSPEAQERYQQLMESLKQQMLNTFMSDFSQAIQNLSPEDMERIKQVVQDLNEMLRQQQAGQEPDFDAFMEQYGDMFGDNPPQSLDELVEQMQRQGAQMQSLLDSLPSEMQQQLQDMLSDQMAQAGMQQELMELASNLEAAYPMRDLLNQYPFRGEEELDLQAAMSVMGQMQDLDELERQIERTQYGGALEDIDADKLEELLGEEARQTLDQLRELLEILEKAGFIRKDGNAWELTPRGTRKIGQKALAEIYENLKRQSFGKHKLPEFGRYGERANESKPYEFGDPFHLQLNETLMNAMYRDGPAVPVSLHPDDFQVYRSETMTQTATVVMLDLSWSMALRGSFQAAKKVAMALHNLISSQYPRDSLYLVGFSAYARELKPEELPYVRWDETVLGTNMHHALLIAQQLLARHKGGTRQIIMISDGEPTAHLENGRSYFAYPPSPITIRETLKEVKHCTTKDIVINIFMLERSSHLKEFVGQVAKLNRGRVFYTTPDQLGEYILVDFVTHRRKAISGR